MRWAARFSGHWMVTSMFSWVTPKRPSHRQLKKTSNGICPQLNQYWSYKPHSNFKPTWKFFKILYVSFKWYFWQKQEILMSVLGLNSKDRKSTTEKANRSNPKVNRGCAALIANNISADCVQISLGPLIPYIPLGVYHTGGFNAMNNNNFIAIHKIHEDNSSNAEKHTVWPKSIFGEVVLKEIHVKMIYTYWSICNDT